MYASSSRLKSSVVDTRAANVNARNSSSIARSTGTMPMRMPRANTPMTRPTAVKSKFTERKPTVTATANSTLIPQSNTQRTGTTANNSGSLVAANQRGTGDKRRTVINNLAPSAPRRTWNRNIKESQKDDSKCKLADKHEALRFNEIGVQTNESEIVDYDQLIGDIKFMLPSPMLVAEIDRERAEARKKVLLKAQRKYEEHSEKQSEHLTDLKEFLEKAVITKRTRKPHEALELDRKLIRSMDELLNMPVPKTESITDIKGRIKKKEKELMTLFETVENIKVFGNKNSER